MKGDGAGAESALREALQRERHRTEVQWRMANLVVRRGNLDEALGFFSRAVTARPALLTETLALVWAVSGGRIEKLEEAAGQTTKGRNDLAFFLLQHDRVADAVTIFHKIDRADRLSSTESAAFITGLTNIVQLEL